MTAAPPVPVADQVPAVECTQVSFVFAGAVTPALDRITLQVKRGERLGILGPNGGGKSTLLKLILGLLTPTTGEVRVFGVSPAEARARGLIGYVPQKVEAELRFPLSAREVASMPSMATLKPWQAPPPSLRDSVHQALSLVGAVDYADRPIGRLSGGQLQRVMIARAIAHRPQLLLLDEPTVGVDVVGQERFAAMLRQLHDTLGLAIIVVSHDLRTIAAGSDRVACLNRTLHAHTSPQGLTPQVLAEVFRHDVIGIFGDLHVDAHHAAECTHEHHHGHTHGSSE